MNGEPTRVKLLPFLAGAAVGGACGIVIGALLGAPLGQALAGVCKNSVERLFGRDDNELRFDLLLQ